MSRVYYASPDIFRPDWPQRAIRLQTLARQYALELVLPVPPQPLTGVGATEPGTQEDALIIFRQCLHHATTCDAVIANLTPFGGREPDSGTVVEATLAYARRIPVIGYIDPAAVPSWEMDRLGDLRDTQGNLVEQFGLPCNLMVHGICHRICDTLEDTFSAVSQVVKTPAGQEYTHSISYREPQQE